MRELRQRFLSLLALHQGLNHVPYFCNTLKQRNTLGKLKKNPKHFTNMSLEVQVNEKNSLNPSLQNPTEITVGDFICTVRLTLCVTERQNINAHKDH